MVVDMSSRFRSFQRLGVRKVVEFVYSPEGPKLLTYKTAA